LNFGYPKATSKE